MHRAFPAALMTAALLVPVAHAAPTEVFSPDGSIARVELPARAPRPLAVSEAARLAGSPLTPIQEAGKTSNRLDLVFLGDGYTAAEQEKFHADARAKWLAIRSTPPFDEYASYFNVWMVDVVSNESGVDNDPRPPTMRDTALDMGFYCQGTERALCVDEAKARAAAKAAPAADQIIVLANSTKYGGVGGAVATSSGGNSAASLISIHELGHSLGGLGDEYDYYYRAGLSEDSTQDVTVPAPYAFYPGVVLGEPEEPNVTAAATAEELIAGRLKWWRWVGEPVFEGGSVGAFEGAGYYRKGLYRPSPDSLMHSLGILKGGNRFNPPSAEQMVVHFYRKLKPVDAATAQGAVGAGTTLKVVPLAPASHALDIVWSVDGTEVADARGARTFAVTPELAAGHATVTATVRDPTPFVRDPNALAKDLTQTLRWTI
jgi:hypothetical protein